MTSSEYDDFEVLTQILQNFLSVRTNVYPSLDHFSRWEGDRQLDVERWSQGVIAVDEGFIEVEYNRFAA